MRFFVPTANDPGHARALYDQIRQRVALFGHDVDDNHIFRIRFNHDGRGKNLAVGDSYRDVDGDPVLAIFKTPSSYLICTHRHGGLDGEPISVKQASVSDVEEFD
jgi:hypothetical protein